VYAGGNFVFIGGATRYYIAALDATTGLATAWDPGANDSVSAFAVSGSTVYVGGGFTAIGGQSRNRIAALDADGVATAWDPGANGQIYSLAVSGPTVYAAGWFSAIGGAARNNIAALDGSGAATTWDPNANGFVSALAVSGPTVYAGGDFSSIGGANRGYIAALDASGGATAWDAHARSDVYALAVSGPTVYAGGYFSFMGGAVRNSIAALDATTGVAAAWDPNANSPVYALAVSGSTVCAGGDFTSIGGQYRPYLARFSPPPTIRSFTPASGYVGSTVTLTGSGFIGATKVAFHGAKATTFSVASDTKITARVPAAAITGRVTVRTPSGNGVSASKYRVKPKITKLARTAARRGAIVTIIGTGFGARRGSSYVKYGSKKCTRYVSWTKTRIRCRVPAKARFGALRIRVTTAGGTSKGKSFRVKR
jgi:hypothetical protein